MVRTSGYYAAGDDGGATYTWSPTSTATGDGCGVLKPAASGAGRWLNATKGGTWYTGKKLGDFYGAGRELAREARARINDDVAANGAAVAEAHASFRAALVAAGHTPGTVTSRMPDSPITSAPLPQTHVEPVGPLTPMALIAARPPMPATLVVAAVPAPSRRRLEHMAPGGDPALLRTRLMCGRRARCRRGEHALLILRAARYRIAEIDPTARHLVTARPRHRSPPGTSTPWWTS